MEYIQIDPPIDPFDGVIETEILWCQGHKGESKRSEDYEHGFIAGLRQAQLLYQGLDGAIKK